MGAAQLPLLACPASTAPVCAALGAAHGLAACCQHDQGAAALCWLRPHEGAAEGACRARDREQAGGPSKHSTSHLTQFLVCAGAYGREAKPALLGGMPWAMPPWMARMAAMACGRRGLGGCQCSPLTRLAGWLGRGKTSNAHWQAFAASSKPSRVGVPLSHVPPRKEQLGADAMDSCCMGLGATTATARRCTTGLAASLPLPSRSDCMVALFWDAVHRPLQCQLNCGCLMRVNEASTSPCQLPCPIPRGQGSWHAACRRLGDEPARFAYTSSQLLSARTSPNLRSGFLCSACHAIWRGARQGLEPLDSPQA